MASTNEDRDGSVVEAGPILSVVTHVTLRDKAGSPTATITADLPP